jgi:hypothetical protein
MERVHILWTATLFLTALPLIPIGHAEEASDEDRLIWVEEANPKGKGLDVAEGHFRQRLQHLKEHNPEAYRKVLMRLKERRTRRLLWLKQHRPEVYERIMERWKERLDQRLETLKKTDPERYQAIVQNRDRWRKKQLEELQRKDPEAYRRWMDGAKGIPSDRGLKKDTARPIRSLPNRGAKRGR